MFNPKALKPHITFNYLHSTGTVIYCTANGNPIPKVTWESKNDQIITTVTGKTNKRALHPKQNK